MAAPEFSEENMFMHLELQYEAGGYFHDAKIAAATAGIAAVASAVSLDAGIGLHTWNTHLPISIPAEAAAGFMFMSSGVFAASALAALYGAGYSLRRRRQTNQESHTYKY